MVGISKKLWRTLEVALMYALVARLFALPPGIWRHMAALLNLITATNCGSEWGYSVSHELHRFCHRGNIGGRTGKATTSQRPSPQRHRGSFRNNIHNFLVA